MSDSRKNRRSQRHKPDATQSKNALASLDTDIMALKRGRSVCGDTDARHAMLHRQHAALVATYGEHSPPPPMLPANVSESLAYLRMLRRFIDTSPDAWTANQKELEKNAQWAYRRSYPANGLELRFDLAGIAWAARQLAHTLRALCPIVGHTFPFDSHDGRALRGVRDAAYALRTLLDYSNAMPHTMAFQINALDGYGHPQRAAVVPLFRLWNTLHDGVLKPMAEAKAESNYALPDVEQQTIDALDLVATELDAIVAADEPRPAIGSQADQGATRPPATNPPAQAPPATVAIVQGKGTGRSRAEILKSLSLCVRQAYVAYELAETMNGKRLGDREAYDYIDEDGLPEKGDLGELNDYKLPDFATWVRYVRKARLPLGEQKYSRRANRPKGRSIANADEVEGPDGDE